MNDGGVHERFWTWLDDGAIGEPPRDLAIHAAVCPVCAGWVRAHDALAVIDTGLAPLPSSRPAAATVPGGLRRAGRYAAAAGALLVAGGLVTFGVSQVISGSLTFFPERTQEVLGATGSPAQVSVNAPTGSSATIAVETASLTAAPLPLATPGPALQTPRATPRRTASVQPTPRPTATGTRTATSTLTPGATASPTGTATPSATPSASPSPIATSTATATPSPSPTPTETPSPSPTQTPSPAPSASAS